MKLKHGLNLAYSTNIHRGETWAETLAALEQHTLAVKESVCPKEPYAIGLRLSRTAAMELSDKTTLLEFQRWLEAKGGYVFTINGFPYGNFHGQRVKEQVYRPDWTSAERLNYTNRLFDLLAKLVPEGVAGSVSTLPGSFKEFISSPEQERTIREQLWRCVEHINQVSEQSGRELHLGLEPEPLGYFEDTAETIRFFETLRAEHRGDERLDRFLGVNYDACHLAIEYEEPAKAIAALRARGIKISKLHLSSALKLKPTPAARKHLAAFADDVYLHQVIARDSAGRLEKWRDLPQALNSSAAMAAEEWRVHFHIPLQSPATDWYQNTSDHVLGVMDLLKADPGWCSHLEMETYTWEVMPAHLKQRTVVEQLVAEYQWTLNQLRVRGLAD